MTQIADQTETQIARPKRDRHTPTTITREAHIALQDAVRLIEASGGQATISGLLSELVARHLPAYVRARCSAERAAQTARQEEMASHDEPAPAPSRIVTAKVEF